KKRAKNLAVLSELKSLSKRLAQLASEPEKAQALASNLVARYDKAVTKNAIPRGRANRRKSRIALFLAKIKKK
ncbi:MAG TPA: 30S ribosomal protein S20, partial [Candidatus Omnitrophota bacterium]|nr:30S ribosomal protein S20 [Candidatus Omnitrophota bacterium]